MHRQIPSHTGFGFGIGTDQPEHIMFFYQKPPGLSMIQLTGHYEGIADQPEPRPPLTRPGTLLNQVESPKDRKRWGKAAQFGDKAAVSQERWRRPDR